MVCPPGAKFGARARRTAAEAAALPNHLALLTQVAQDGCESMNAPFARSSFFGCVMKRFIDHPSHSDAVEMGSVRAFACCVPRPYVISVAAGILPAVVPGILPCEN